MLVGVLFVPVVITSPSSLPGKLGAVGVMGVVSRDQSPESSL